MLSTCLSLPESKAIIRQLIILVIIVMKLKRYKGYKSGTSIISLLRKISSMHDSTFGRGDDSRSQTTAKRN